MERYPFSFPLTVPEHDCDALLRFKPSAALRYMQMAAADHLESLALPYERLVEEGIVFVLAAVALKFHGLPAPRQEILVSTCPVMAKGAQMLRETVITSREGELLVEGQSSWAIIDPDTKRLLRPSAFGHTLPTLAVWNPFCDPSRMRLTTGTAPLGTREVRYSDLDRNLHMNNTVYADVLTDPFGADLMASGGVDTLFIRYRNQTRMRDTLLLRGGCDEGIYSLSAALDDSLCFEGMFSLKPTPIKLPE